MALIPFYCIALHQQPATVYRLYQEPVRHCHHLTFRQSSTPTSLPVLLRRRSPAFPSDPACHFPRLERGCALPTANHTQIYRVRVAGMSKGRMKIARQVRPRQRYAQRSEWCGHGLMVVLPLRQQPWVQVDSTAVDSRQAVTVLLLLLLLFLLL